MSVTVIIREVDSMYFTAQELVDTLNVEEGEALTVRKIRYYAQIGLLSAPELVNGKKKYTSKHLEELRAIRKLQKTGNKLEEIKASIQGLDIQTLSRVSENAGYISQKPLVDRNVYDINEDIAFLFSHRVDGTLQKGLIEVVEDFLQKHKGEL